MQKRRIYYTPLKQTKKHHRQPTKRIVSRCSHWTNIAKADRWTIWTKSSEHIGWSKIRRSSKRILGGRWNSIFWHKVVLLKRYQRRFLEWKWEEEKVQQQSNVRGAKILHAISIFSERWYGSWVQEILLSISRNDNTETKARTLHHNVLVATKNLLFANEINLLCIRGSRDFKSRRNKRCKWHRNKWIIIE